MSNESSENPPAVVITGASTGIGAECALDLDGRGFRVFAGIRKPEDGVRLKERASDRLTPLWIDVTDADSVAAAAEEVHAAVKDEGLLGLVNNAGIVIPGPMEMVPIAQIRRQFDVNVIGQMTVTQAFLPMLRPRPGRLVNMGSISGRIAVPYMGVYAASKFAMEAVTDALRIELRPWGIHVSIVEPDVVKTPIWDKVKQTQIEQTRQVSPEIQELYATDRKKQRDLTWRMGETGMPVERVVRAVRHALCAKKPKTRYPVGWRVRIGPWMFGGMPDRIRDWIVKRMMGLK